MTDTRCSPVTMDQMNGGRPLPFERDELGRLVREAWVRWALTQPNPKQTWLVPYNELEECDKEADRHIGESIARWTLVFDACAMSSTGSQAPAQAVAAPSQEEATAAVKREMLHEGMSQRGF